MYGVISFASVFYIFYFAYYLNYTNFKNIVNENLKIGKKAHKVRNFVVNQTFNKQYVLKNQQFCATLCFVKNFLRIKI